ncbi:hypothetical protein GCM10009612_32050 [Streptomyces beijiangensis]
MTPSAAAVATAASTALPPLRSTSIPAAEASVSTLDTAPPYPTATGVLTGGPDADEGGDAAASDTTAAVTASSESFRAVTRRINRPPYDGRPRSVALAPTIRHEHADLYDAAP